MTGGGYRLLASVTFGRTTSAVSTPIFATKCVFIFQHFSRSTRFAILINPLHRSPCSKFCSKIAENLLSLIFWRFERKCFRANIETSAAKTRRSRMIFLLISVGEDFVVFHLLHFYTEDCSFAEVRKYIFRKDELGYLLECLYERCNDL